MRIFTLNCFALPLLGRNSTKRLKRIVSEIKRLEPDIVCLQEIFYPWHKKLLERELKGSYPYSFVPRNGFFMTGGGICFFSRLPIRNNQFKKFSLAGSFKDWTWAHIANEQGFMKLTLGEDRLHHIFHTHLSCNFENKFDLVEGSQADRQKRQLSEIAQEVESLQESDGCFVIGDLNLPPSTKIFQDFLNRIGAVDLTVSNEPSVRGVFYPFPKYFSKLIHRGKIDYVLFRGKPMTKSSWKYFFDEEDFLSDHAGIILDIEF